MKFFLFSMILPGLLVGLSYGVDVSSHCFTSCNFPDTNVTLCYSDTATQACGDGNWPRQDGDYVLGASSPSYTLYSIGAASVTVDNRTGLMWVYKSSDTTPNTGGGSNWVTAISNCESTTYAGYGDWRLPNISELMSIVDSSRDQPAINTDFFVTSNGQYWSSTTPLATVANAWVLGYPTGIINIGGIVKTATNIHTRCVRGGP